MTPRHDDLTFEQVDALLAYDGDNGIFTWKENVGRNGKVKAGDRAGWLHRSSGSWMITIGGCDYQAHRLAVLLKTGSWPPTDDVDHRDLDRSNNRWLNIRCATQSQNRANTRVRVNNKLGIKGVHLEKSSGKFVAQIMIDGRKVRLGAFSKAETAAHVYRVAAEMEYGEFSRTS